MFAYHAWIIAFAFAVAPVPDSDAGPWVTKSENGRYIFKMVPEKRRDLGDSVDRPAFGVAYQLTLDDEFKEQWRVQGWYAREGYLSGNGKYFIRIGPVAIDQQNHADLAIAFYSAGKLIKQYEVRELIKDPSVLENYPGHYLWRPAVQTEPNRFDRGTFHLVMIDRTSYTFEIETGEIIRRETDPGAKGERQLAAESLAAAKLRTRNSILRWALFVVGPAIVVSIVVFRRVRKRRILKTNATEGPG